MNVNCNVYLVRVDERCQVYLFWVGKSCNVYLVLVDVRCSVSLVWVGVNCSVCFNCLVGC